LQCTLNRNIPASRIQGALLELEKNGWARCERIKKEGPGRPEERWFAC
jgi:hypothetical protein